MYKSYECAVQGSVERGVGQMLRKNRRRACLKLLLRIMKNDAPFYRKTGVFFLKSCFCRDRELAGILLKTAMEKGDERAYLLYHRHFSRKKKIIDDVSYREIFEDYMREKDKSRKQVLREYLKLGTRSQKRRLSLWMEKSET